MDFRIGYRRPLRTATILRRKRQRTRLWIGAAIAVAVAVAAYAWEPAGKSVAANGPAAPMVRVALNSDAAAAPVAARRIYPYSIVPGGVATRADLARRVAVDDVVARHYASFDIKKAHPVTAGKGRAVHVSYRKGDKVYWTANKVMLAEGETLLSDGTSEIRGRCGNRISDTARLPVAMGEPSAEDFDASMNVAADSGDDGNLQNASFGLDDPLLAGNPTSFRTFPGGITPDAAPATPLAPSGMPSVPMGPQNGMGLLPTGYITAAATPAIALGPVTQGAFTVTPDVPAADILPGATPVTPPVAVVPAVPATPDTPVTPIIPVTIAAPTPPVTPLAPDVPVTPATPVTPGTPATPGTPTANPQPPVKAPLPEGEIPEPGTRWLVGAAFALLLAMTRKRRAGKA